MLNLSRVVSTTVIYTVVVEFITHANIKHPHIYIFYKNYPVIIITNYLVPPAAAPACLIIIINRA